MSGALKMRQLRALTRTIRFLYLCDGFDEQAVDFHAERVPRMHASGRSARAKPDMSAPRRRKGSGNQRKWGYLG